MAQVLVTGSTGIIGANLIRELLATDYTVRALVRASSNLHSVKDLPIEHVTGDVLQVESLVKATKGCQLVFHAATPFSYDTTRSEKQSTIAINGIENILAACQASGVPRLILTSSSVICGSSSHLQVRDETCELDDQDPPAYIMAKMLQEKVARELAPKFNVELIIVCPTLCVGPYDYRLGPSSSLITQYLIDPFKSTFPGGANIVAVEDVAIGHRLAAEKGNPGERYIFGSENMEWSMIHRIISELCGISGPLLHANHTLSFLTAVSQELISQLWQVPAQLNREQVKMIGRFYWYSHEKATILGYKPRTSRKALVQAIGWLLSSSHIPATVRIRLKPEAEVVQVYQQYSNL